MPGTTVLGTAEAATALTTAVAVQNMAGVAYTIMRTPEGMLKGGTLAETCEMLNLTIQMHALTTITTVTLLGMAIRYTPRRLRGPDGMAHQAKAPIYIAGRTYS